ncbi:MAG TPA: 4-hydroxy-tetrahydrodipicolinate reductase [Syntrophomonadaceae bacterium]|nr:4-hydroxy-tetrahydrodipicolinate reductase [Syntrophomonadaceae bacterium]
MPATIRVIITGVLGKMGVETAQAIIKAKDMELVGAVDVRGKNEPISTIAPGGKHDILIQNDLDFVLEDTKPDIMIDFTNPQAVFNNAKTALNHCVTCIIGTTGLNEIEIRQLEKMALEKEVGIAIIPNFAIGAVLMMKFAKEAAEYFPDVEIIEMHHDQKMDAPSGTAIKTAEMISEKRTKQIPKNIGEYEKIAGSRGGDVNQIRIHSVRLPGFVAHQEVIFGGIGQSLRIKHDSIDRIGFMPGVTMVIRKMIKEKGLIYGMEDLM